MESKDCFQTMVSDCEFRFSDVRIILPVTIQNGQCKKQSHSSRKRTHSENLPRSRKIDHFHEWSPSTAKRNAKQGKEKTIQFAMVSKFIFQIMEHLPQGRFSSAGRASD